MNTVSKKRAHFIIIDAVFFLLACMFLNSCSVDLGGFFSSDTAPDDRFTESRNMAQPGQQDFGDSFSFIFVTDIHITNGSHAYFRGLKSRLEGASFIVVGGDIAQDGGKKDFDEFISARDSFGIPVYAVPGNHDLFNEGWKSAKAIGPSSFTVKLGPNTRLVCLDSANGTLGTLQTEWLQKVLTRATESTLIVASHMNFFSLDGVGAMELTSPEETALLLSMYQNAGVSLCLAGHTHAYDEEKIGSMKYYVGGSYENGDSSASYLFITCSGGKISVERHRY